MEKVIFDSIQQYILKQMDRVRQKRLDKTSQKKLEWIPFLKRTNQKMDISRNIYNNELL
jgi:hypothetical protein